MPYPALTNTAFFLLVAFLFPLAPPVEAAFQGVISDPDGFVNVRASESAEAAVIATVKTAELPNHRQLQPRRKGNHRLEAPHRSLTRRE